MRRLLFLILVVVFTKSNAQTYFRVEQDYPDGSNGQYSVDLSTLPAYSDGEIKAAFSVIVNSEIYFNYPQGGCQNRAEMMHIMLEKQLHIEHSKIWIFAPTDLFQNDNRHLEITDPNGNAINSTITWKYHVAPSVRRKNNNGTIDTLIIDPAIDHNKAMLLKDWLGSMRNSNVSKYTFLNCKWYFFTTNGNIISGTFYPYATSWQEDFHRSTMERGLATNDLAKYVMQKLKDGYSDSDGSIKWLLANQDEIYNLFMNPYNMSNNKTKLLTNHSIFMRETEQYYWQRLAYWQSEANRLIQQP